MIETFDRRRERVKFGPRNENDMLLEQEANLLVVKLPRENAIW